MYFQSRVAMLEEFSEKIFEKLKIACGKCVADTISLSGGLDSTILAYFLEERKPKSVAVITKDSDANDLMYCQLAARQFNLPLTLINANTEKILEGILETIKILKNFNDIEIRNNIVMYLAIKWAKDNHSTGIITGDGSDELFAGYNFLLTKTEEQLEQEINRISSIMHFPTKKIGKALGVKVETPFLDEEVKKLALEIPVKFKVGTKNKERYGKWILRKTFESKIPQSIIWRKKSPMQDGAGTNKLEKFFENIISDTTFKEKIDKIKQKYGIKIRTKESLYYFEIYNKLHGMHITAEKTKSCPYCQCNTENSKFCRMCGAFPI